MVVFVWMILDFDEQMDEYEKHDTIWQLTHTKPHRSKDDEDHKERKFYKLVYYIYFN